MGWSFPGIIHWSRSDQGDRQSARDCSYSRRVKCGCLRSLVFPSQNRGLMPPARLFLVVFGQGTSFAISGHVVCYQ